MQGIIGTFASVRKCKEQKKHNTRKYCDRYGSGLVLKVNELVSNSQLIIYLL